MTQPPHYPTICKTRRCRNRFPGILVEALSRRRQRELPPFTVLSCDNIPNNGHVVKTPCWEWQKNGAGAGAVDRRARQFSRHHG